MDLVSTCYPKPGLPARVSFEALTEAETFFSSRINQPGKESMEVWLKKQQAFFEGYLPDYCGRGDRKVESSPAWQIISKLPLVKILP
jgi:hypothetical protein